MTNGIATTITISAVAYPVYGFTSDPVADADSYFAARLGATDWTGATTLVKQQGLITAAREFNVKHWDGTKTVSSQSLEFPRDDLELDGVALADNLVPERIVLGEFEYALKLIATPTLVDSSGTGSNIRRAKAGSAEVEYFRPTIGTASDLPLPQLVFDLVSPFLAGADSALLAAPRVGGDDEVSSFNDCHRFGLNAGFP